MTIYEMKYSDELMRDILLIPESLDIKDVSLENGVITISLAGDEFRKVDESPNGDIVQLGAYYKKVEGLELVL